jgi:hypothetical protein
MTIEIRAHRWKDDDMFLTKKNGGLVGLVEGGVRASLI